ncbi:MAG: hypothetical protein ACRDGR_01000 [bacterium]
MSGTSATYVVFARRESQEPLTRLGTVTVKEGSSVAESVTRAHGKDWIELVAIPDTAIGWAIGGGEDA